MLLTTLQIIPRFTSTHINAHTESMITFKDLGRYGRISNQMFQIAGTIGIAEKCGHEFGFPYWRNYDHKERFGCEEDIDIQNWFKNPLPEIQDGEYNRVNIKWGYHDIVVPDWSDLKGHMQSDKYFSHCESTVRHYFEFTDPEPRKEAIAVHFRGGDYGDDYHPLCSTEYYSEAISTMPDLPVILFTDDPERAKSIIPFDYELSGGKHSMDDLKGMASCTHHIIANSTFSWWGAWLGNSEKVVAPKRWFGPAAKLITEDIYCKDWIVI